jgi:hypothetical protein
MSKNSMVTGFMPFSTADHAPGRGRIAGKVSRWDILHPGRGRETATTPATTYEQLCGEAEEAIRERIRILGI